MKEAALDSPIFRATSSYLADQLDHVERWLEGYVRAGSRMSQDLQTFENSLQTWLQQTIPPSQITEAVLDQDYALLITKRYAEAAKQFWQSSFTSMKASEKEVLERVRAFINGDLKLFRDARKNMDSAQKLFDTVAVRYAGLSKTREASSLREEAFQLHEARVAYLKASLDYCSQSPLVRAALDKLIVRIFADQWKDLANARESSGPSFIKWSPEVHRIRGWAREIENSERIFKKELLSVRKQIEESAEQLARPPRELEDYAEKTAPYLGSNEPSTQRAEKQGWLFLKSISGSKPARTVWSRKWFFVKSGIFGWLATRSGGVEESEKIGLLLCSIRPALQEERRFCFEVKTKDSTMILQAESQIELKHWIDSFDLVKKKALEDPVNSTDTPTTPSTDAFAIRPPVAPELAADAVIYSDEQLGGLNIIDGIVGNTSRLASDVSTTPKKSLNIEREQDQGRDQAPRIIQKLDLHRKATPSAQIVNASARSHIVGANNNNIVIGAMSPPTIDSRNLFPPTSLAPGSFANPPAPTNLSKTAVVVSGERSIRIGQPDGSGMPGGVMANLWGTEKWSAVNRLERNGIRTPKRIRSIPGTPNLTSILTEHDLVKDSPSKALIGFPRRETSVVGRDSFPTNYPPALKAQDAQFRMLFPDVSRSEKVVLVFRATWNPNDEQEFPGRVYLTTREIYFYSNHLGFVLISGVSMEGITEITSAPGRECDFLFLHLKDGDKTDDLRRVTIKIFLEPLKVLQKRLNFLVQNANADEPKSIEDVINALLKMDVVEPSPTGNWDEGPYSGDEETPRRLEHEIRPRIKIDGNLYGANINKTGREVTRFKLPSQPVIYAPPGMGHAIVTRDFSTSAKALFHVMFGDKSTLFQFLYQNRGTTNITQSPWDKSDQTNVTRTIKCTFDSGTLVDTQTIDVHNDHLCYVVVSRRIPFNFPSSDKFTFVVKFVITHSAKSQCRLAIFDQLLWTGEIPRTRELIERRAKKHLDNDVQEVMTLSQEQVNRLGHHSNTNKAIHTFGQIGQSTQPIRLTTADFHPPPAVTISSSRKIVRHTLLGLYWFEVFSRILKILSLVFDFIDASLKSIMTFISSHSLLLSLLLVSIVFNSWHTWRDGSEWLHERRMDRFVRDLGIKNDNVFSKSIYLKDVESILNHTDVTTVNSTDGETMGCRKKFENEVLQSSTSLFLEDINENDKAQYNHNIKLWKSRKTLAEHRHDLIVSMRVINKVEEEILQASWEHWLKEEDLKCKKMMRVLITSTSTSEARQDGNGLLVKELEEYCSGCREELEAIPASRYTT